MLDGSRIGNLLSALSAVLLCSDAALLWVHAPSQQNKRGACRAKLLSDLAPSAIAVRDRPSGGANFWQMPGKSELGVLARSELPADKAFHWEGCRRPLGAATAPQSYTLCTG